MKENAPRKNLDAKDYNAEKKLDEDLDLLNETEEEYSGAETANNDRMEDISIQDNEISSQHEIIVLDNPHIELPNDNIPTISISIPETSDNLDVASDNSTSSSKSLEFNLITSFLKVRLMQSKFIFYVIFDIEYDFRNTRAYI